MNARFAALLALVLSACTAAPPKASTPPVPGTVYAYRIAVEHVPAGTGELELCLRLGGATGGVRALSARGLVGNAAFEQDFDAPRPLPAAARIEREEGSEGGQPFTDIRVRTAGRALELELRLESTPAPAEAELARELAQATTVKADGAPLASPTTRLVRVR